MVYLNSYNVLKYEAPHSEHPETKSKLELFLSITL